MTTTGPYIQIDTDGTNMQGGCHYDLCNTPAKSQQTINGITWDYLGPQKYCDGGCPANSQEVYRATAQGTRYYLQFSSTDQAQTVIQSFKMSASQTDTCMLTVDNQNYPISPCNETRNLGGKIQSIDFGATGSKYYVYLSAGSDGVWGGYWNGPQAASHANDNLGTLTKVGNCYQNDRVKLCESGTVAQ
ncbi:MAG: hypothetical protein JWO43_642, partial [Candidatus Adlerbacteria bacterium]|nr:hypothetical protein [Candidatus Adlerbacteria bacterium]